MSVAKVVFVCPGCGHTFSIPAWAVNDKRAEGVLYRRHRDDPQILCCPSNRCYKQRGAYQACEHCGVRVYVPARAQRRFCSMECYQAVICVNLGKICSEEGCDRAAEVKGRCPMHHIHHIRALTAER
jgi:hypothetical protein